MIEGSKFMYSPFTYRRLIALLVAGILLLTSCGSTSEETAEIEQDVATDGSMTDGSTTGQTGTTELSTDVPASPDPAGAAISLPEASWDELEERFLPALGGMRFGIKPEYSVHHDANMAVIRQGFETDSGRYLPSMVIALVGQYPDGSFLHTVDQFTGPAVNAVGSATANGTTLNMFGLELAGYSFRLNEDQPVGPHYIYSAYGRTGEGPTAWQPFPFGELFLAEAEDGVLAIGYTAATEQELEQGRKIFETVAPTVSINQTPVPANAPDEPEPIAEFRDVPALQFDGSGPPVLAQGFQPVDPGTYRIANLATAMEVTFDEGWWVQPNFPGFVAFTGDDSFGPGDRGLTFRLGIKSLVPSTVGPVPAGPVVDLPDMSALIDDPPTNLEISNVQTVEVGGYPATRFDIRFSDDADCSAVDPCQYLFRADVFPLPEDVRTGYVNRIWHISEGVDEPITVFAATPDASWFSRAEELLSTITLG
jgi:hypothetical protein